MNGKENLLKTIKNKKLSTTAVAGLINRDHHYTLGLLNKLLEEKKIIKTEVFVGKRKSTYWSSKKQVMK